ncbi:lipopolysaccharide exporter [Arthrobacter pascens]|uniref:lipopolysaccharide biosynthesis protein n=1 Tax=Arthrobacter pascens TaxID=1677 RepID=UPI002780BDF2|nr:lipopolysaccharide biosynthesis protein [Arthrobacter pascens]MDQ0636124.1 lipopolysaccharide exporter [Arthrobacter pascens]
MSEQLSADIAMGQKVRRGLVWSTASNIVLRLSNLAVGIIMARLIAPEAFGVFAVALTTWSILGSLAEFGLGADLVRRDDYQRHLPTVGTLGLVLSSILAGAMYFAASHVAIFFGSPEATSVVQLMSISIFLIGLSVVPAALLQRNIRQGTLFAVDASSMVISTLVMALLAITGFGPAALALGRIAGQSAAVVMQYIAVGRWPEFGWDREVAREAVGFGLPLATANFVAWLTVSVDNLMVARTLGPLELGLYALAFNVASWPMSVAGQSVRVIALPAFSRLASTVHRGRAMVQVSGPIWAVSILVAVGLMFLAPQLVSVAYGDVWMGAVVAVVPLAAFGAFRVIFDLAATYLIASGHTRRVLLIQAIWLVTLIPAMFVGVQSAGLAGAGWAHVIVALAVVLPAYLISMRRSAVPTLGFIGAWIVPTLAGLPLAGVLWLTTVTIPVRWLALTVGTIAGSIAYALPLMNWWLRQVRELSRLQGGQVTEPGRAEGAEPELDGGARSGPPGTALQVAAAASSDQRPNIGEEQ